MMNEFEPPYESEEGHSDANNTASRDGDSSDIRAGARQEDQLEKLNPEVETDAKNANDGLANHTSSAVENGSEENHQFPTNEQKWPENKVPTK